MRLSVLYEERWLPPEIEKFGDRVYQKIIDNPGDTFLRLPTILRAGRTTRDHRTSGLRRPPPNYADFLYEDLILLFNDNRAFQFWAIPDIDDEVALRPHIEAGKVLIGVEITYSAPKTGFGRTRPGPSNDELRVGGWTRIYSFFRRVIDITIYRKKDERHKPFTDREKLRIHHVIMHELAHCMDPKLLDPKLTHAKWGSENSSVNKKLEQIYAAWNQKDPPNKIDNEYYITRPWEMDAEFTSRASQQYQQWKQQGLTTEEMLDEVRIFDIRSDDAEAYKKYGYWNKFLSYLYKYIKHKSEATG
jgi:hypothetical protein